MRLDKFLTMQGRYTRAQAKALVRQGRVIVDGVTAADGGMAIDPTQCAVLLDGEQIAYCDQLHLMLNKPAGVLTAANDPRHRTVMDLLPPYCAALSCMPIGRLDLDTQGLLLLTTDGTLAHRLLAPKRGVEKIYEAQLDGRLGPQDVEAFAAGVALHDFTARPARLEILPPGDRARVTVCEGKYHQVKRMFQARGRTVLALKRLSFGGVTLDASLAPGQWRELTEQELRTLRGAAEGSANG